MASLVADYSDSSDEGEEISSTNDKCEVPDTSNVKVKEEPVDPSQPQPNFFSSDLADSDDDEKPVKSEHIKPEPPETFDEKSSRLPNPLSAKEPERLPSLSEAKTSRIGTSVFVNPFEEAEQAKTSILERHVRLTEAAPQRRANQPICWKFKKGKCSLGKNCRFFHDVENVSVDESAQSSDSSSQSDPSSSRQMYHQSVIKRAEFGLYRPLEAEPEDSDGYMAGMKRKKRYGVGDHLVPPKKAMNALMEQRMKERPWTMNRAPRQDW